MDEKKAINDTRLLFGKSTTETKEFFESIGIASVLAYMKGENIEIPYIGEIKIQYNGDETTDKGRQASLITEFKPSTFLINNIGQVEDGVKTDAEKTLLNRLRLIFKSKID